MSKFETNYRLKLDFRKVHQHAGGKWLILNTKHHNENQLLNTEPPIEFPNWECTFDIKGFDGNVFKPIF